MKIVLLLLKILSQCFVLLLKLLKVSCTYTELSFNFIRMLKKICVFLCENYICKA